MSSTHSRVARAALPAIALLAAAPAIAWAEQPNPLAADERHALAFGRWAALSAFTGSRDGYELAIRACADFRESEVDLRERLLGRGGMSEETQPDVIYRKTSNMRVMDSVSMFVAFCDALVDRKELPPTAAAAVVDGPGGQRAMLGAALEKARPFTKPAEPETHSPAQPPALLAPPTPPAPVGTAKDRILGIELSGGMEVPLTPVNSMYALGPAFRVGPTIAGERWRIGLHLAAFGGPNRPIINDVERSAIGGFIGLDAEPSIRLTSSPLILSAGALFAFGVLGRHLDAVDLHVAENQATAFGSAAPLLRLDVPLSSITPYVVIAPGVAFLNINGTVRAHAQATAWVGFQRDFVHF